MSGGETASELARSAAALLGETLDWARAIHGGDLSRVVRLRLASGREAVAKTGAAPRTEAEMLRALRAAGAPVPEVLGVSDEVLMMEALEESGGLGPEGWEALGAAMRALHDLPGENYGWPEDYAFGPVAIRNAPAATWPEFWAERRLLSETADLPAALSRRLETLARRLPELLPARPVAGLLHGDLWAGNVVAAGGRLSGLIDPACHRGHGEVDLAMLSLFGSPGSAFSAGYGALEAGAGKRRPIYQLWPAIVHLRLFGGGYRGLVERLLDATGV